MTAPSTRDLGSVGEELATKFLQKKGYKILGKNFHSKLGEIDIIALDPSTDSTGSPQAGSGQGTLVFVEVKARWTKEYGPPEEAVTPRKIRSIIKTGQYYKLLHPKLPEALRIDVVTIDFTEAQPIEAAEVKLIKNVTEMHRA